MQVGNLVGYCTKYRYQTQIDMNSTTSSAPTPYYPSDPFSDQEVARWRIQPGHQQRISPESMRRNHVSRDTHTHTPQDTENTYRMERSIICIPLHEQHGVDNDNYSIKS